MTVDTYFEDQNRLFKKKKQKDSTPKVIPDVAGYIQVAIPSFYNSIVFDHQ